MRPLLKCFTQISELGDFTLKLNFHFICLLLDYLSSVFVMLALQFLQSAPYNCNSTFERFMVYDPDTRNISKLFGLFVEILKSELQLMVARRRLKIFDQILATQ